MMRMVMMMMMVRTLRIGFTVPVIVLVSVPYPQPQVQSHQGPCVHAVSPAVGTILPHAGLKRLWVKSFSARLLLP